MGTMEVNIKSLKKEAEKEIEKAKNLEEANRIFKKYSGKISQIFSFIKNFSPKERAKIGKEANEAQKFLKQIFEKRKKSLSGKIREKRPIDITVPAKKPRIGHLHPLTLVRRKLEEIFQTMGFSVVEGPEIEDEYHNFDALNIPPHHPARDLWDTLWLKTKGKRLLLRTHTSPVQIRYMEKNNPPLRIIAPGRVFRHEATDASHDVQFYQLEGLMIGKDVSVANFKAIIQEFFSRFFGKQVKVRLRPSFFPFVEPGFEVDMSCASCGGKGCSTCKRTGWVEIMGAGMVHPNVLKSVGYNPKNWQGFAFGMGVDRLAMMKYKINDIRLFYSGDLRFIGQF